MNNQRRICGLFKRHPRYFIGIISCSYPLSNNQIAEYQDKLLWGFSQFGFFTAGLSSNLHLDWSLELIDEFIDKWDWRSISSGVIGKYVWTEYIIERYYDRISWTSLSYNQDIPWSEKLIDRYEDKIDWIKLSSNAGIPWTKELVKKYEDKINWSGFSNSTSSPISRRDTFDDERTPCLFPPDDIIDFVERYEDRLDWSHLMWDWRKGLNRLQTDRIIESVMKSVPVLEWPPMSNPF